jgi:Domain of Unknown Function (DUF928)
MKFSFYRFSNLNPRSQFPSFRCFQTGSRAFVTAAVLVPLFVSTLGSQVNAFEPPPKSGAPKGTSGGGTRPVASSRCLTHDAKALQTLTPPSGVGYTAQQHPQFWVYLPPHQTIDLEFTLQALDPHPVTGILDSYQVMIPAPVGSGWTVLDLPQDVPALDALRVYRWSVALVCDPTDRPSNDAVVRGNLIYDPKSLSTSDEIEKIRSDYWLDAMSKMSENGRITWIKSHSVSIQGKREGPINPSISDESWKALLLQSRVLNPSPASQIPIS